MTFYKRAMLGKHVYWHDIIEIFVINIKFQLAEIRINIMSVLMVVLC